VLDAEEARSDRRWMTTVRRALMDDNDTVILTHVDSLDVHGLRALSAALQEAKLDPKRSRLWVAVTLARGGAGGALDQLLCHFPASVEVAPLRLRREDLPALVSFFLAKLNHGSRVSCSADAMRLLMRSPWPGNVEQLHQVLHGVVQRRRAGIIQPADLPPETQTVSGRLLSALETMERDAIVTSLADANGNKVKAARSLGMSRATIYRKIHEYGIVVPATRGVKVTKADQEPTTGRPSGSPRPPVASAAIPR
jgi:sigma-54 dependent transcriptional regulator, acetoin dehydrogenase operon transcriptional activator AcoR